MAVLLMRHGPTALNHESIHHDRIRGWMNVPLSPEGHQIAAQLAQKAAHYPIQDLHSSDLSRAADTAHAVSQTTHQPVQLHHGLRPWNLGKLSGQPTKKVLPLIKSLVEHPDLKAPGGESFSDFMRRFLPTIAPMLADKGLHGVVTHIRNIKVLEALIAGHGSLHQPTWDKMPSVDPGGMAYADESRFEPLSKESASAKASAGS